MLVPSVKTPSVCVQLPPTFSVPEPGAKVPPESVKVQELQKKTVRVPPLNAPPEMVTPPFMVTVPAPPLKVPPDTVKSRPLSTVMAPSPALKVPAAMVTACSKVKVPLVGPVATALALFNLKPVIAPLEKLTVPEPSKYT